MADLVLPPALRHARNAFRYIDNTGVSRGVYNGIAQTTGYGGDRVGATIELTPHGGRSSVARVERAQLQSLLMALRGKQNRLLITDQSYTPRGSWPSIAGAELYANADFSNGTTGWNTTQGVISVSDGVIRLSKTGQNDPDLSQSPTLVIGVPYVLRSIDLPGSNSIGTTIGPFLTIGSLTVDGRTTTPGYKVISAVAPATTSTAFAQVWNLSLAGVIAGAHAYTPFASFSRCFLSDGGGNSLLRSDEIDNAAWSSTGLGSVTANALAGPDNVATAELLNQNTSSGGHYRSQNYTIPSAAADFAASACFKASNRTWAFIVLEEQTGGTAAYAFVNLSTGAIGTVASGANMTNARGFVVSRGNGWYELHVVARKTNAATTMQVRVCASTGDNVLTYSGSAEGAVYVCRSSSFASGVPLRQTLTTSAAAAASSQTGGAIYVKGLPVSQTGLLVAGDWVEIDGQLKMVLVSLDSDAAGMGYLQFSPPLRRPVADNTPIIVTRPMGRFLLAPDQLAQFSNEPGLFTQSSIELEEA